MALLITIIQSYSEELDLPQSFLKCINRQVKEMRISIVGVKGGSGKSTISLLLSKALAEQGENVLLVDRDPLGWSSRILGLKGDGLVKSVVEGKEPKDFYAEKNYNLGKLSVIKFFGEGPRFYTDMSIVHRSQPLMNKIEELYTQILKKKFDFYVVDNPSYVDFNDEVVKHELSIFLKNFPDEEILRIYVTDPSEPSIAATVDYVKKLESQSNVGKGYCVIINLVPPYPEDIDKVKISLNEALEETKLPKGFVLPFIEKLFQLTEIEDLEVPEEVKELARQLKDLKRK
ncbi:MAG: chromosome partitioning ATPase [Candidatus Aramenus sulfurataquae]|jgi:MinD-like ATPase involved in chromosome partitioning or flagellar assembly|uniref:Chromosome partitioning ATPase n=2 Tax=Candidatus Aramenus sulfurataquae TaxID=1326980 RepID=W7KJL0_9CREN|nr:MAG: chromosome partitioning ATPase [Candidatus Aramenus sulfurataquae]MCL7344576.1 ParA family protein [Candidatus Aramenus sulfurataquae]